MKMNLVLHVDQVGSISSSHASGCKNLLAQICTIRGKAETKDRSFPAVGAKNL